MSNISDCGCWWLFLRQLSFRLRCSYKMTFQRTVIWWCWWCFDGWLWLDVIYAGSSFLSVCFCTFSYFFLTQLLMIDFMKHLFSEEKIYKLVIESLNWKCYLFSSRHFVTGRFMTLAYGSHAYNAINVLKFDALTCVEQLILISS